MRTHFSHPGGILKREFLDVLELSVSDAAARMSLTPARLNEIVRGERGITADTALRLAKLFGTTGQFWLNLQSHYDLVRAEALSRPILRKIRRLSSATRAPKRKRAVA